jgi:hypothetical protein
MYISSGMLRQVICYEMTNLSEMHMAIIQLMMETVSTFETISTRLQGTTSQKTINSQECMQVRAHMYERTHTNTHTKYIATEMKCCIFKL